MKNVPLLLGTILGTGAFIIVVAALFSKGSEPKVVDQIVLMNNAHLSKGVDAAKVTVVEFADLQCPACGSVHPLVSEIVNAHPKDVRFIFRHYPLVGVHQNAQYAAQAVEAAASIDIASFWKLHDYLYENQTDWSETKPEEFKKKIEEYATKLEIDKTELLKRIDSQVVKDKILTDVGDGNKLGVSGTPTFYVNGQETSAPQLKSTVEAFLAK